MSFDYKETISNIVKTIRSSDSERIERLWNEAKQWRLKADEKKKIYKALSLLFGGMSKTDKRYNKLKIAIDSVFSDYITKAEIAAGAENYARNTETTYQMGTNFAWNG